ncbi:MAG: hypothetical protein LUQ20_00635 [Candidatus Methanoperedens sp.]|nr:hypothetical protein [Candidatus Methanoperedens sp.]
MTEVQKNTAVVLIIITVLTVLAYGNSLRGDFVCDDRPMIINNEKIASIEYLPHYFTHGVWDISNLGIKDEFLYRPLFLVYLFLNYQIWGVSPFGFHLASLLLHICNSILVFFLLRKVLLSQETIIPLLGTIIFAVHPVHTESVSWISGATDLILTFFFLSSFLFYLIYRDNHKSILLLLSIISFIFSLLSKEVAVVLPLIIIAYDYLKDKKIYTKNLFIFILVTILYLLLRGTVLGGISGTLQFSFAGLKNVIEFISGYIKLLFIPWPLVFYFSISESDFINFKGVIFSAAAFISIVIYVIKDRKSLFPVIWIFVTLLPALLLAFHSRPAFAERFLYLPSAGFVVFLAYLIEKPFEQYRKITILFTSLIIFVFSAITVRANLEWKNDEVFYFKAIRNNQHYAGAYLGLAQYYERKGQIEQAIAVYTNSLNYIAKTDKSDVYEGIALIYGQKGDTETSIYYYQKVLEINPKRSGALVGIGNNYFLKKEYSAALHFYEEAFAIDKKNYEACYNLALINKILGNKTIAAYYYDILSRIAPKSKYALSMYR